MKKTIGMLLILFGIIGFSVQAMGQSHDAGKVRGPSRQGAFLTMDQVEGIMDLFNSRPMEFSQEAIADLHKQLINAATPGVNPKFSIDACKGLKDQCDACHHFGTITEPCGHACDLYIMNCDQKQ